MNIYIGNLPYSAEEDGIRKLFEEYGEVSSVKLIADRDTGRLKGFGFIEMDDAGGDQAIEKLNGMELEGRNIKVNQAKERTERPNRY
ncbi:RNA recognition motif domain-containing protein [Bacteroidota bacterium]